MEFGRADREEMLKQMGDDIRAMPEADKRSVRLALSAFAYNYILDLYASPHAKIRGLTKENYIRAAAEAMEACWEIEGADAEKGLELLIKIGGCTEQGDVPRHIVPTQKGNSVIMYMVEETLKG